jgi:hypothetical protein
VTPGHAGALQKVSNILALGEEHVVRRMTNSNANEVVEITEVSHRKLVVQPGQEALEKIRGGGGDNDVIEVKEKIRHITA